MTNPTDSFRHGPEPLDQPLKHVLARLANGISPASVAMAYADWLVHLAASPAKQAELAGSAWRKALSWRHYATHNWRGDCERCIEPLPQDKRFSPREWQESPLAAALAQASSAGSWWPRWHEWLARHSSGKVAARAVAGIVENGQPVPAPGSYVHQK